MKSLKFLGNLFLFVMLGISPFWAIFFFFALLVALLGTFAVAAQTLLFIRVGLFFLFLLSLGVASRIYGVPYSGSTPAPAPGDDD